MSPLVKSPYSFCMFLRRKPSSATCDGKKLVNDTLSSMLDYHLSIQQMKVPPMKIYKTAYVLRRRRNSGRCPMHDIQSSYDGAVTSEEEGTATTTHVLGIHPPHDDDILASIVLKVTLNRYGVTAFLTARSYQTWSSIRPS